MAKQTADRSLKKADVLQATGISLHTFQHWMDRRLIILSGDDIPGDGKGRPRRFGMRRVYQIAIAHKIASLGIPANTAITLAARFTDEPQRGRPIGGLFPQGRTVLIVSNDGTSKITNVEADATIDSFLTADASLIVDVGAILNNIHTRLDILN
jgi:hypothetical protein